MTKTLTQIMRITFRHFLCQYSLLHLTNLMRPLLQILSSFPLVVMLFMTNLLFPLTWMMLMPSSYLPWTWFLLWKRSRTKLNILLYTLSNHSMARNHT